MKGVLCFLLVAPVLGTPALAVDTDEVEQALPEAAQEILGETTVSDAVSGVGLFKTIWQWAVSAAGEQLSRAAKSACTALSVALLCSLAGAVSESGKTPDFAVMAGALAIMSCCAGGMTSFLGQTEAALAELSDFSKALLPCIAAASAAAGSGAAGAARYTASALGLDVLMTLGVQAILPLIYAYAAVSAADAALPGGALGGPVKLLGWLGNLLLTGLTTAFTLCLTLSGLIAGSADKLAGSLTKTAISAALPVVGSILSDAADTYLAGASLLRNGVGIFGLAAVLCVCVGPVLGLGLHYLLFKAAACLAEPFSQGRLSVLIGNIGTAYGMALGLLGSAAAMLFVSIVLSMEAVTG
ncbi:MAG: hypothetical protein LUG57_06280 [Oscillospiraceae bacterium]|nr:hypothetical protein [Oscillospiraceae bacterium]